MQPMRFCQSCRMPLSPLVLGTEADGTQSQEYCKFCYDKGAFTQDCTMEEMIAHCVPLFADSNPDMTLEEASDLLHELFPQLTRWKR